MKFLLRTNQFPLAVPSRKSLELSIERSNLWVREILTNLYFRLAQGNFEKDKDTFSNSELSLSVEGGEVFAEKGELRVPIEFNEGKSELKITYSWAE